MNALRLASLAFGLTLAGSASFVRAADPATVRSAASGPWSAAATWEGGRLPAAGDRVLVRPGHRVRYDVESSVVLRSVHVGGTLAFAPDQNTRLDVGLLMVRPGEDVSETGIGAAAGRGKGHDHGGAEGDAAAPATAARPALEVGTADRPIDADKHAVIRLTYVDGMDKDTCPALVDSGGRMDLFGAALPRTWLKLGERAKPGDTKLTLAEPAAGWRAGDKVIVVSTAMIDLFDKTFQNVIGSVKDNSETEERTVAAVDGATLTLDAPLKIAHTADGEFRGEVADLSRNVVVESADPAGVRGHTMYHRGSAGAIAYAEFRHLGKAGTLGRYPIHFHECGESMRGASVVGASIWDSANRWVTIHGTNYLVVRDVVGYQSAGHGFFMEDGTEVYNVFDRNLAVQALRSKPLPQQMLGFDKNDGAGFWWANSLNAFTRNVAAECDQHGYRYEVVKDATFDPVLPVRQPDGSTKPVDVRTLPFVRFDDNEAHSQRRFGLNLGGIRAVAGPDDYTAPAKGKQALGERIDPDKVKRGDVGGVGPDRGHPFFIRNLKVWTSHWAFHGGTPSVRIEGLRIDDSNYGLWRSRTDLNEYKNLSITRTRRVDIFNPWGGNPSIEDDYAKFLRPVDDLPPATVVTRVGRAANGDLLVRGTTADNGEVTKVLVNGRPASATAANFGEWEVVLAGDDAKATQVTAAGTDKAGNAERTPHVVGVAAADRVAAAAAN